MCHTSGLVDGIDVDRSQHPSLAAHADAVCRRMALGFAPGTNITYSSAGIISHGC